MAELLYIKGLGVPDEDSTEIQPNLNEERLEDTEKIELRKNNEPKVSSKHSIGDSDVYEKVSIPTESLSY